MYKEVTLATSFFPLTQEEQFDACPLDGEELFDSYSQMGTELEFLDEISEVLSLFKYDLTDDQILASEKTIANLKELQRNGNLHPIFMILLRDSFQAAVRENKQNAIIEFFGQVFANRSLEILPHYVSAWATSFSL